MVSNFHIYRSKYTAKAYLIYERQNKCHFTVHVARVVLWSNVTVFVPRKPFPKITQAFTVSWFDNFPCDPVSYQCSVSSDDCLKSSNIPLVAVPKYSTLTAVFLTCHYTAINIQDTTIKWWKLGLLKVAGAVWYPPLARQHTNGHSGSDVLIGLTGYDWLQASLEDAAKSDG
jgi:hypothetical protein